jgi:tetratricopeptide (TPR) repeat protein
LTKRLALLFALFACHRELRPRDPSRWLELKSEHFTLQTDIDEPQARQMIDDLEYLRHALYAAAWHPQKEVHGSILVVALASEDEVHEFVADDTLGVSFTEEILGQRTTVMAGDENVLGSRVLKHEIEHALVRGMLINQPRWVTEGLAAYLEEMEIDRAQNRIVRGTYHWKRRAWVHEHNLRKLSWSLRLVGGGGDFHSVDGFSWETMAWVFTHWLIDTRPAQFDRFLERLSKGEAMWPAFNAAFPDLPDEAITREMTVYMELAANLQKRKLDLPPFSPPAYELRHLRPSEVHALRALLFDDLGLNGVKDARSRRRYDQEVLAVMRDDPSDPMLPLLSDRVDPSLAIEKHPESGLPWIAKWARDKGDLEALQKAVDLLPEDFPVIAQLARQRVEHGEPELALRQIDEALKLGPSPFVYDAQSLALEALGRCEEAVESEQRALDALSDEASPQYVSRYRARVEKLTSECGKTAQRREVKVEPVLLSCRQPLEKRGNNLIGLRARFTVRENGAVSAVAIQGTENRELSDRLSKFVESCQFEPVRVDGKPRSVQLDLALSAFMQ